MQRSLQRFVVLDFTDYRADRSVFRQPAFDILPSSVFLPLTPYSYQNNSAGKFREAVVS
jgi:hypothetical protein